MAPKPFALRAQRAFQLACALTASLFLLSCADSPTGSDRPGFGSVTLRPAFASSQFAPITLDRIQVVVTTAIPDSISEGIGDTLVNLTRTFGASAEEVRLSVPVPLAGGSQQVDVQLRLLAGPTLLFQGFSSFDLTPGQTTTSEPIDVDYVGPGSNAVGLIIEPFDTTVTAGSTTPFRATAINGQENDVGPFYMRWSVSSTANGASIDAAGRLHAPAQPGTVWVRGNLPNGVDDSVQVTVTGTPGGITIVSGNHQTGQVGSTLELPLVIRVTTGSGAPVEGATVTWGAPVGGGGYDGGQTRVTDANGESQNTPFLGQNPGVNHFTATVAGAGTVTFLANEDQTGSTVTWIGNTSTVWSNAANWSGGKVPDVLDSVVIPSAEFYPVLDTTPILGALTLSGNSRITIADHGLIVVRNLTVRGNSTLEMLSANDIVTVGGDATFEGGDSRGHLTAGVLSVVGNFIQRSTNSAQSFSATGSHVVSLAGNNTTVSFANPGTDPASSSFQDFAWSTTGSLTLASDVVARGSAFVGFGGNTTITSTGGFNISAAQLATNSQIPVVFNNVTIALSDSTTADDFIGAVTFQNMPTNRPQLKLRYPGGSMTLSGFTFSTTPVAPNGYYIEADDSQVGDANNFTVNVTTSTPASGGAFIHALNGAVIRWPPPPPP